MNLRITSTTYFLLLLCFLFYKNTNAQLPNHHLTPIGNLPYTPILSGIWSYADSSGEYALVGHLDGLSIVSLANPALPTELFFVPGNQSIWREVKTYSHYAYAVTEGGGGVMIVDLSHLPDSISYHFHNTQINRAHTLWIDETGFLYIAGGNIGSGEPVIFNLANNPNTPTLISSVAPPYYSHDLYTRGDTMWSANIYDGFFSVFDISDRFNPVLLATQQTPKHFTHNVWLSDDSQTLFTTDEKPGSWVAAYDVSDLTDIRELDRWRTPNAGVIPHNVHVKDDFLVIAYYTDGVVVLDGSRPDNLIEVARYDTHLLTPTSDFDGVWGVDPFLPSGLIVASDRQTGLHVLQPNYQRACWLEGTITDSITGATIWGALVQISTTPANKYSNLIGQYKTGTTNAGIYQVTVSKLGYYTKTFTTTLANGQLTIENVELVSAPTALLTIELTDNQSNTPVSNGQIEIIGIDTTYTGQTDQNGLFQQNVLLGNYDIWAGHWGHQTQKNALTVNTATTQEIKLNRGYKDEFALDLGWTIGGSVSTGNWLIETPDTVAGLVFPLLRTDANDLGEKCLTTGAYPMPSGPVIWMDSGSATISSPIMDLSQVQDPYLGFQYHYYMISAFAPTIFNVLISNGIDTVVAASYSTVNNLAVWKNATSIPIKNHLILTNNMQVHFHAYNYSLNASGKVKVWIDDFAVTDSSGQHIAIHYLDKNTSSFSCHPNPFGEHFILSYQDLKLPAPLQVFNITGQLIDTQELKFSAAELTMGGDWKPGVYFVRIGNWVEKVVKW